MFLKYFLKYQISREYPLICNFSLVPAPWLPNWTWDKTVKITFKSTFFCIILFIDVSCRCGKIFLYRHNIFNKYYYARNLCPTLCLQPCYLKLFSMVEEEEKCESHDTLGVTSLNTMLAAWVENRYVLSSVFHIFITLSAFISCVTLPHATLLSIFLE